MDITAFHVVLAALVLGGLATAYWLGTRAHQAGPAEAAATAIKPAAPQITTSAPTSAAGPRTGQPLPAAIPTGCDLTAARSWGYQLQNLKIERAAASPFDVLVIDTTRDGDEDTALTPADLTRLRRKPDGSRRIVLAYLSIGEAESYRPYWDDTWARSKPDWLLGENPDWDENYAVCFWSPAWQRLMFGTAEAALDRVIAAGFDGVYLDKCDVYEDLREHFPAVAKSRRNLEADMVAFVARLSAYAKSRRAGFQVVMQNAEELVREPGLLDAIDAIAKEELIFGLDGTEKRNSSDDIDHAIGCLRRVRDVGKPVFCIEYLAAPTKIADAKSIIERHDFVFYAAAKNRELDRLTV